MKSIRTTLVVSVVFFFVAGTAAAQCSWVSQSSSISETCGSIGIGVANPLYLLHMVFNSNNPTPQVTLQNTSTGSGATTTLQALNDLGTECSFSVTGSQWTAYGAATANTGVVYANSPNGMVIMADNAAGALKFSCGGPTEKMRLDATGHLGVGTASPTSRMQVAGDLRVGTNGSNTDVTLFTDTPATMNNVSYAEINSISPVTVPASGQTTRTALHLKNATATGQGTNQIDLVVDGTISGAKVIGAVYQDLAEWVNATEALEPATVVVLDRAHDNQVAPSTTAYDTTVAGVVSENPGLILGVGAAGKEKIATTGRVRIKADATGAPIRIGDLLVTSDVPGTAMKSQPIDVGGAKIHRPGTIIGKALQALPGGRGEILVLLSMQ